MLTGATSVYIDKLLTGEDLPPPALAEDKNTETQPNKEDGDVAMEPGTPKKKRLDRTQFGNFIIAFGK